MPEFLLARENIPFAVAVALLLILFVIELVGFLLGVSMSDLGGGVDADIPDIGGPDIPSDLPTADLNVEGLVAKFLGWLNIGRVPLIILLVVFLAAFALAGYAVQAVVVGVGGFFLPWFVAVVPAFLLALPVTRTFGGFVARLMPKDETAAVDRESLVGLEAVIVLGVCRQGSPAQGKTRDRFGTTHYVMIEPDDAGEEFSAGQSVLLVRNDGHKFFAIRHPGAAVENL